MITFPENSAQCNVCHGKEKECDTCENKRWVPKGSPHAQECLNDYCSETVSPGEIHSPWCSHECKYDNAC